jgi:hypothetical protein
VKTHAVEQKGDEIADVQGIKQQKQQGRFLKSV